MQYKYETHCHTSPVSFCGRANPEETVLFYQSLGYDGVFITNHFLDGNINPESKALSYEEQIEYYFSDYEAAAAIGKREGIKVFPGVELSYKGTDFLIYGLSKEWYLSHPEIMEMKKTEELAFMMQMPSLIVQAHPYREAGYIDHIRLFPRSVHAVEVINSSQTEPANIMAGFYADQYGLLKTAGSDNHWASGIFDHALRKGYSLTISGMMTEEPLNSPEDYIRAVFEGKAVPFTMDEKMNMLC